MIWLPTHPLRSALPCQALTATHRKTDKEIPLAVGGGGGGLWDKPNHTTARKPGPL